MKRWALAISFGALILTFQNCQKSGTTGPASDSSGTGTASEYQKTTASDYPTVQMWDYQNGRILDVDVSSGKIAVYLNFGNDQSDDRCLTDSQLQQLQTLLSQAQVCAPVVTAQDYAGQECAMNYQAPYAVLVNGGQTVRLGERTNSCDVPTDLCGDAGQALLNLSQNVISSIDQLVCP